MSRQYFGTDGIRGTVGQAPITPDFVLMLAHAVGQVLKQDNPRPKVLIGKDTRISGYMLESALESGLARSRVTAACRGSPPSGGKSKDQSKGKAEEKAIKTGNARFY